MAFGYLFPKLSVKDDSTPKRKTTKISSRGFCLNGRPSPKNTKLTDTQVKEVRWLSEFRGWTNKRLEEKYQVSPSVMRNVLGYLSRGRIHVKKDDFVDSYFS